MSFGRFQLRRDTAANWTANNPVLASGEVGLETDTVKIKFGDGSTAWVSLAYFSSGGGGVSDGDKGDIVVSGSGTVWTIDTGVVVPSNLNATLDLSGKTITLQDNHVTFQDDGDTSKKMVMQLSGITTATTRTLTIPDASTTIVGTDATQTLTNKSIVATQLTGTLQAGQFPALTGDVTTSAGALATTIANSAVTYAKIQNVSATDKLLGRATAGAGVVEEIALTAAGRALIDDVDASAQRTTLGLGTLATQSGTFSGTSSGTNTGDQLLFQTIQISGQSDVVADTTTDVLTLVAGSNITLTTNASTDTITIAASTGGVSDGDKGDIVVSGSGTVWTIDAGVVTAADMAATLDLGASAVTVQDNNFTVKDNLDTSKKFQFQASGITTATTRTITIPDANTTMVGTDATQTLTNKSIVATQLTGTLQAGQFPALTGDVTTSAGSLATTIAANAVTAGKLASTLDLSTNTVTFEDANLTITDDGDTSKKMKFQLSGITTATTRTLTVPDATTTLVGTDATQTLTNKSIVATQLTGTLQAGQEPAHTGDVTNSAGSLALTIAANAVTVAKMATTLDLSANTVTFKDANLTFTDDIDATKKMVMQLSGITTGTTRTLTIPDASTTLVGTDTTQTLTNKSIVATQLTGTLQAGQEPAHTGDVTNSAGSLALAIAANAVTAGKLATTLDLHGNTITLGDTLTTIENTTDTTKKALFDASTITTGNTRTYSLPDATTTLVGTGTTQTLTNKSIVATQLTGTLQAGQFPALTGDVTTSAGALATTIANSAVTYAKMQNVSATDLILGRSSAGAGVVQEIACTAAGRALIAGVDAAAERTTLGLGTLATQSGTFSGTSSGTNTGDQNIFQTISVSGQSDVVADTTADTLTFVAGTNMTITTTAGTDTITFAASGGGSGLTQPQVMAVASLRI